MKKLKSVFVFFMLLSIAVNLYATDQDEAIKAGIKAVESKDFPTAIDGLKEAIKKDPNNSEYHRWLGRVYGLQAQDSNWFKAMSLAKKARVNFEKAVALDQKNIEALLDLREFYLQAPEFLGGGQDKAEKISKQLVSLGYVEDEEVE